MAESALSKKITKAIKTGDQLVQDLKSLANEFKGNNRTDGKENNPKDENAES